MSAWGAGLEWIEVLVKLHNGTAKIGDECLPWPYGCDGHGYARVTIDGRVRSVAHLVLEGTGRPRPPAPGNHALHSCVGNPRCVHPDHLRWGTHQENMDDRSRNR